MLRSITGPGDKSVLELNQSEVLIGTQTANHLQTITDTETKKSDQSQETNELSDGAFTKENSVTSVTQFFVFDDEPEEKLKKEIDTIKSNIRSLDNPELEQKVVNGLNQIKKEFTTVVEQLQSHVQKLSTKFVKEREDRETEYAKLESHLQKSLLNSKKMMEENKLLKKAFFEMKDLLNSKDLSTIVKDSDNQN
ncbi:hypothetical protein M0811_01290 [Anaeramoeba ignava]|uniref:Uncharacterized protein n=1 Tax=Anaeramoeba ignava TaxID=1746090 RepID=A0A9Q0LFF0_ANAIG|nr:hypothetical protein M0811_01290 [Anaeramoeba ignava]